MTENARALRLAETIQRIVANALDTEIKDPRLGFITITDVRVTGDLQNATVFYTVLGDDEERADTEKALASAKGHLRSLVGAGLDIRLTPDLEFIPDALPDTTAALEQAIRDAKARDAEAAALREGADYAGDPDPYRRPEDADEQAM